MEENTDNENLLDGASASGENISDEITPVNNANATISNQENGNVEVHHRPKVEKKNFKEYLLEFIMIFLAVTMGFIAENIREHLSETKIAHQNLEAYRNDLLQHEEYFKGNIANLNKVLPIYDSIITIFYTKRENEELPVLSRLLMKGEQNYVVTINTPTYQQLISSGSLRFIENKELKAGMANYQYQINNYINYNDRVINTLNNMLGEYGKIIDTHDFWNGEKWKNFQTYTPEMKPFALSEEQRNFVIFRNKGFSIQFQSGLNDFNKLLNSNAALLKLIDEELDR